MHNAKTKLVAAILISLLGMSASANDDQVCLPQSEFQEYIAEQIRPDRVVQQIILSEPRGYAEVFGLWLFQDGSWVHYRLTAEGTVAVLCLIEMGERYSSF